MPSAKVTSMTFTFLNKMSGWHVEQKSQRENGREFTHCDQIQYRQSESPSKRDRGKQKIDTREETRMLRMDSVTQQVGQLNWLAGGSSKTVINARVSESLRD